MAGYLLPAENLAQLGNSERALRDVLSDVNKLEECDVECQDLRDGIAKTLKRIESIRRNFGGGVANKDKG